MCLLSLADDVFHLPGNGCYSAGGGDSRVDLKDFGIEFGRYCFFDLSLSVKVKAWAAETQRSDKSFTVGSCDQAIPQIVSLFHDSSISIRNCSTL